ncbi:UNVERIFIED_CONTAM: hypothetical protein ABID98_005736 [Brevibacillus sp. OAP136]
MHEIVLLAIEDSFHSPCHERQRKQVLAHGVMQVARQSIPFLELAQFPTLLVQACVLHRDGNMIRKRFAAPPGRFRQNRSPSGL